MALRRVPSDRALTQPGTALASFSSPWRLSVHGLKAYKPSSLAFNFIGYEPLRQIGQMLLLKNTLQCSLIPRATFALTD